MNTRNDADSTVHSSTTSKVFDVIATGGAIVGTGAAVTGVVAASGAALTAAAIAGVIAAGANVVSRFTEERPKKPGSLQSS